MSIYMWREVQEANIDFLLIGGGGGGSKGRQGGGGAGGVIQRCGYTIEAGEYPVVIGAGGVCDCNAPRKGQNGEDSCFGIFIAYGGGAGSESVAGCDGGSGGGGGSSGCGGSACTGQGYNGGKGCTNSGGGGGGAGGAGCDAPYQCGGMGGIGIQSDISGTMTWYAGGGSGFNGYSGCGTAASCGGTPSGGYSNGNYQDAACTNAIYCGAGGGGTCNGSCSCGKGGNGLLIVRYPTACGYNMSGGTKYACGDYTIHCFTSNGTLTLS